jgi:(1->4)-alpha-D-glucan 1-alpha-D-glucosylmutase
MSHPRSAGTGRDENARLGATMDEISSESADDHAELLQLCQRHGIAPEYHDIWGKRRVVPGHGLRALLRAMDVEAGDRAQVRASLAAEDAAQAALALRSPLPPVAVFWQDAGPWLLALQAANREGKLLWELVEEGGAHHAGTVHDFHVALPARLPLGYHRLDLRLEAAVGEARLLSSTLIVIAPRRCYLPPRLQEGQRVWGPAVQLYALRSARNWGIGDFTDLAAVVRSCGAQGAALVGLNPLHALYPHNPGHASPYSPSSRRFLNVLYIDVEAVAEFLLCAEARARVYAPEFQDRLRALRAADLVDYVGVAAAKLPVLELLYAQFRAGCTAEPAGPRAREFRAYQSAGGLALRQHALFEAMQEHFHAQDAGVWGWPQWSWAHRDPNSAEVGTFLREHADRVEYYEYLQWQAEAQLAGVGRASLEAGLAVGIYQDLAVSVDRGGAESWAAQDLYAQSASAGCPPDDFNLRGQDWGLLPLLPDRLRARAYAPFIAVLRANMRHAGALRIDHVMGLARLFWVPRGDLPEAGSYVSYPFDHLLAILTLESERNRCMVIGEDLGTVPDEVRHAMDRSGMLSYRVLIFSRRHDGEFFAPADFPLDALVTSTTHDLATLVGYWEGRDIELRQSLDLYPSEAVRLQQVEERKRDCGRLLAALRRESLLPPEMGPDPQWPVPMTQNLAMAVQEYLARSRSRVLVVQLEDIFGARDQVNLPGTVDQYANWRRKLPVPLEHWESDGRFAAFARRLAADRRA